MSCEEELSFIDVLHLFVKRRVLFFSVVLLCLAIGVVIAFFHKLNYRYTNIITNSSYMNERGETVPLVGLHMGSASRIAHAFTAGITAGTTQTQGGATALIGDINEVSACANVGDGVRPPGMTGLPACAETGIRVAQEIKKQVKPS